MNEGTERPLKEARVGQNEKHEKTERPGVGHLEVEWYDVEWAESDWLRAWLRLARVDK